MARDQIHPEHLRQLINSARTEDESLDYKAELPTRNARGVQDFLKDVAAFANSEGGELVYGVVEELDSSRRPTGRPAQLTGVATENADQELLRLQSAAHDGLDPSPHVDIQIVRGDFSKGPAFVVRVDRSGTGPVMVKSNRTFYVRRKTQNVPLQTVDQLRSLFSSTNSELLRQPANWTPQTGETWLRTTLVPDPDIERVDLFGDLSPSLLAALEAVELPLYLSAPLTTRPNSYFTRSTISSILHEDFRKLESDGVGFRIEIHERGTVDFAICLDELVGRYPVEELKRESPSRFLPGSAPIQRCHAVLPYDNLASIFTSQLVALALLWRTLPCDDRGAVLFTSLTRVAGVCIYVPGNWSNLLSHPPADEDLRFSMKIDPADRQFQDIAMQHLIRGFGLRLDSLHDEHGRLRQPALFAQ